MNDDSRDIRLLSSPVLFSGLVIVSSLLSLPACFAAVHFIRRGLAGDTTGGVASGLIGLILIAASIAFTRAALNAKTRQISQSRPLSNRYVWTITAIVTPLGLISIWGSVLFLLDAATLINQEYLHWFPVTSRQSFGDTSTATMIWAEFMSMGELTGSVGAFLIWFAVRNAYRSKASGRSFISDRSPK